MMEKVECFNHKNESLKKLVPRDQMKNAAEYFRVIHAWIINQHGEYLVQKRAKKDDLKPFMWAFTTGMVLPYEEPLDGIIREVDEELNFKSQPHDWTLEKLVSTHVHPYKTHTYVFKMQWSHSLPFQIGEEVSDYAWWNLDTILQKIDAGDFWDYSRLLNDATYFLGGRHASSRR